MISVKTPSEEPPQRRLEPENPQNPALTERARTIFAGLPERVRPIELMRRYPRTANRLAAHWERATDVMREFSDLLIDYRRGRDSFPVTIALEVYALHDYYLSEVSPQVRTVWQNPDRARFRA